MRDADVVILGEVHDNPYHHANQARAVTELAPAAMVFEQLTPDFARRVTPELLDDAVRLEAALEWQNSGWPDFAMYYPIFAAAPDAAIFGGAADQRDVRRSMGEGAAQVFGGGAAMFGLDRPFSNEVQSQEEDLQMRAHCDALPTEMLAGMVEAQRLRDAALAQATVEAVFETRERGSDAPVILITGNGHARADLAVPAILRAMPLDLTVLTVAQFEGQAPDELDFDYWLVTDAAERDDPCAAFK